MIFNINNPTFPIVTAAIHDGHSVRDELLKYMAISDKVRLREEDPYTGEWLSISDNSITTADSRFEVDLNRVKEKAFYLSAEDAWGLKVWKSKPPIEELNESLNKYSKFYSKLEEEIKKLLEINDIIVIYDLHSYNYKRNGPYKPPESDTLNPELNLGTGTLNRERWAPIIDRFIDEVNEYDFMGRNIDIRENIKFRGGHFPRWIHERFPANVCCLSIEFRKFFMNEWTGEPFFDIIDEIKNLLRSTVFGVLEEVKNINSK